MKTNRLIVGLCFALAFVSGCLPPAQAQPTQPATRPAPLPPAPSVLDRRPAIAPPCTTPQTIYYLDPGDISTHLMASADNVRYVCAAHEQYSFSGGTITAKNVTLVLNGSTLTLKHKPGDGCDIAIKGDYFALSRGTISGDKFTCIHNSAAGVTLCDLKVGQVNIFLLNDPTAISTRCIRVKQLTRVGGQFFYNFADSFYWEDCELVPDDGSNSSSAESPVRFSAPDPKIFPGYLPPVGCVMVGGSIFNPASAANLQKSAVAVRQVNLKIVDVWISGAIGAGQVTGADNAVLDVEHCTFDKDSTYPSISTQSGVRLTANDNRFRGGNQPIGVGSNSTVLAADGNTIVGGNKHLIFHQNGKTEEGTHTVHK